MESGGVSAPELDVQVLDLERLARSGRVKTGIRTTVKDEYRASSVVHDTYMILRDARHLPSMPCSRGSPAREDRALGESCVRRQA